MIAKAVMPVTVKDAVLKRDEIGQGLFNTFVKERIVERKLSVWSPMKKANLETWKTTRQKKKSKTASGHEELRPRKKSQHESTDGIILCQSYLSAN